MLLSVKTNTASLIAQSAMEKASADASASINRLSTGNRLDRAGTDIIALTIGESLNASKITLDAVLRNSQQSDSMLSVADTGLRQSNDLLLQMKELSVAAVALLTESQRGALEVQFASIQAELNRIASNTDFNGVQLLNGAYGGAIVGLDNLERDAAGKSSSAYLTILGQSNQSLTFKVDATGADIAVDKDASYDFTSNYGKSALALTAAGGFNKDNAAIAKSELETILEPIFGRSRINVTAGDAANNNSVTLKIDGTLEMSVAVVDDGGAKVFEFTTTNLKASSDVQLSKDNTGNPAYNGNINFIKQAQQDADILNIATVEMLAGGSSNDIIQIAFANAKIQNLFRAQYTKYNPELDPPSISTAESAKKAMDDITAAIDNLSIMEAKIGVSQRRLKTIQTILEDTIVAQESTRSNYQDTNYILEPSNLASANTRFDAGRQSLAAEMQQRFRAITSLIQAAATG